MKNFLLLGLLAFMPLRAASVTVDASDTSVVDLRKIFDAFRSANPAGPNRLKQIGSRQVRMFPPLSYRSYGLGNLFDVVKGSYPNWTFDFSLVDNDWVEPVIRQGADIILGYCYMPESLGPDALEPPDNYDAWEEFNYQWAKHYYDTYGITTFEIWNEPDYSEFFTGSRSDYFEMYNYAARGIKRAVPHARIGGPALAGNTGWVGPFLDYIIKNNLPVHFISYHAQDNGFKDDNSAYYNRYNDIVNALDERGMDSVTVVLDEFSYELDPGQDSRYNRSEAAAWFAGTFQFMLNNMPRLSRFNKTITDNGELADKWKYNGLVTTDNIPKAKFNVFRMYAMMPDQGIAVSTEAPLGALASIDDSLLAVMIWNKENTDMGITPVYLSHLPFTADSLALYTIDANHSSYFDNTGTAELERTRYTTLQPPGDSVRVYIAAHSVNLLLIRGSRKVSALREQKPLPATLPITLAPNPFNGRVNIDFNLSLPHRGTAAIYDMNGRKVHTFFENRALPAGPTRLHWTSGSGHASGIYIFRLQLENQTYGKTLYLLK
ncbi:MAG: T9SS C-terminal target domain-containing protein [Calditrichaeota bacterium]|nr:MAG: T9SS C-terminal target domain-containing protein [Calditrichota bacterium]